MGRKEHNDRRKGGFQKKNAQISKKNQHRGGHRVKDNFKGKKNFNNNNNYQKPAYRARNEQPRQNKPQKQVTHHDQKKSKKNNLGQYSQFVGKSLFQMIPEGQENGKKDKFAALNGDEDQQYDEGDQQEVQYDDGQPQEEEQMQNDQEDFEQEQPQIDDEQQGSQDEDEQEQQNEYPGQQQQDQFDGDLGQQEQIQGEENEQIDQQQQQAGQAGQEGEQAIPTFDDDEEDDKNVDISVINLRIQETLQVLMNLPKLGQGKPRKYFVDRLKKYIHRYYGYNFELIDHFLNFLNPAELVQFFEANETQRPLTIRTNTLKTRRKELAQALIQRGVNLDPLAEWSKVGIKIYETKVPIGATPEYLAGHYMLQSASSLLPVLALDPQMNEKILDMASAPGGKTSYIAQIMKNTGSVFANDLKKDRLKALQFNIWRLGITNTVVTCRDGRKYPEIFPNSFDRVLLDAPCTGLGIISKDHSIKTNRVLLDIYKNSHVQKQLLLAAIDCTKVGGVVVYSTCSVSPLENQQVINYALKKRYVKIVDIDDLVEVGDAGLIKFVDKRYHVDLRKTKRIYPHVHNIDGFYLGKLVKIANGKRQSKQVQTQSQEAQIQVEEPVQVEPEPQIEEQAQPEPEVEIPVKKTKPAKQGKKNKVRQ